MIMLSLGLNLIRMTQQMKKMAYFFGLLIVPLFAQAKTLDAQLQESIQAWKTKQGIPAISITIQKLDQSQPLTLLMGTKTLHGKEKINSQTLFQIGSITKTFVSILILQLEAEGKLNINDPIGLWLPEYPRWQNITIKELLNMRSGIYNYTETMDTRRFSTQEKRKIRSATELINYAYQHPDYFTPGTQWHYSNTNYLLAGLLLERVSGQPLEKLLKERILDQYQLSNTFYYPVSYPSHILKRMAHGYRDQRDTTFISPSFFGSAGCMISSSSDLAKWTHLLFTGAVLPVKQQREFMNSIPFPDNPPKPAHSAFGLGIYVTEDPQLGKLWWYSGVTSGYIAVIVWIPSQAAIISANINRWQGEHYGVLVPKQEFLNTVIKDLKENKFLSI